MGYYHFYEKYENYFKITRGKGLNRILFANLFLYKVIT